jgi:hypothetical protein
MAAIYDFFGWMPSAAAMKWRPKTRFLRKAVSGETAEPID